MNTKGQTALEYLLLVVVSIMVVVSVMVWMQSTSSEVRDTTSEQADSILCSLKICAISPECESYTVCGGIGAGATCGPLGKCQMP